MRRLGVALWLAALVVCGVIVARADFTADLTAFLPRSRTPAQELLVAQLRDGVAARLVLIGLESADEPRLAEASRALARRLADTGRFSLVTNGESGLARVDRDRLFEHRYLLSPMVNAERFSEAGLRAALEETLRRLASPLAPLIAPTVARDPTGELAAILAPHLGRPQPPLRHGVWFDPARERALLIAETRAPGYELDEQAQTQGAIRAAFEAVRTDPAMRLILSGPSVFAVQSRTSIEHDARTRALAASLGVALLLLAVYRRPALLAVGLLPVATGVVIGVAAVALGFEAVHAITLGFGATLIGEAADYPTYLLIQRQPGETLAATAARIGPTLWLAVLTTVFGALAMLLSSFTGLAQLGTFLFVGALAAGVVTRYALPALVPAAWTERATPRVPAPQTLRALLGATRRLAWVVPTAFAAAAVFLAARHATIWENELAGLNPIPIEAQNLDRDLRAALGAPDVRLLVAVRAPTRDDVLAHFEWLHATLDNLVATGSIKGYDTPARYLPSTVVQRARQAALPAPEELAARLDRAAAGLPFREGIFAPFVADVARARGARLLEPADLDGTAWGLAVRSLLTEQAGAWTGLAPLADVTDPKALAEAIAALREPDVVLFDLKAESDAMVTAYRDQSLALAGLGTLVIAAVLAIGLRRPRAVLDVLFPVLAAIAATAAILVAAGVKLSLLHLVSLLLVLGVGTNYALFFHRFTADAEERLKSAFAVLVAAATTLVAFGALSFSETAILHAIGTTVALGAAVSLVFSAAWSRAEH